MTKGLTLFGCFGYGVDGSVLLGASWLQNSSWKLGKLVGVSSVVAVELGSRPRLLWCGSRQKASERLF